MKKIVFGTACSLLFVLMSPMLFAGVASPEHIARMNKYDVTFYWLDLNIQKSSNDISGNALTRAKCLVNELDTFSLELTSNFTIDSVLVSVEGGDFENTDFAHSGQEVNVLLDSPLTLNQEVEVRVFYHGTPLIGNLFNSGGFFSGALGKFSATPPYNAATWWPCKQSLTDMADSSWFYITTAAADKGLSNGLLDKVVDLGENKRWEWKSKYPINFYLIAFVVTSFEEVTDYWHPEGRTDSLMLNYYGYVPPEAHQILQIFSDKFGLYPFYEEKLGFAKVNLDGGIENQTLIASNGGVDAHEIAHQWFGNYVGCASWKDIMLSEGLATWAESVYAEFKADPEFANAIRMSYFTDNTTTSSVFGESMDTTTIMSVFGNASLYYKKAAMVINSLRYHINDDELFFQGIKNYLSTNGGKSVTAQALRSAMEETTGVDLEDFFNQWYYKGGAPNFNIRWNSNGDFVAMEITQTTNNTDNPLFKTPVDIKIKRTEGDVIVRLFIDENFTTHQIYCPGNVTSLQVDPNQWITNGYGTITKDASISVGIDEQNQSSPYSVYPNPAKDFILLSAAVQDVVKVKLFDMSGKMCYSNDEVRLNEPLYWGNFPEGSYILSIEDRHSQTVRKLIIK